MSAEMAYTASSHSLDRSRPDGWAAPPPSADVAGRPSSSEYSESPAARGWSVTHPPSTPLSTGWGQVMAARARQRAQGASSDVAAVIDVSFIAACPSRGRHEQTRDATRGQGSWQRSIHTCDALECRAEDVSCQGDGLTR